MWTVWEFGDNSEGRADHAKIVASFWDKERAIAEAARLNEANSDPSMSYESIESRASGVYPADEKPPWVNDPDKWRRRGYEQRR